MQFRFFTVPINGAEDASAELNRFLSGHRILAVDRQLVIDGPNSAWALCVSFDEGGSGIAPRVSIGRRGKVDFKEVLTDPEFAVFARLRALRKEGRKGLPCENVRQRIARDVVG